MPTRQNSSGRTLHRSSVLTVNRQRQPMRGQPRSLKSFRPSSSLRSNPSRSPGAIDLVGGRVAVECHNLLHKELSHGDVLSLYGLSLRRGYTSDFAFESLAFWRVAAQFDGPAQGLACVVEPPEAQKHLAAHGGQKV